MKVSLNWLKEFVDLPTEDPGELSHVLAMLGHEVEGVETVTPGWTDVVVARVETVEAHPDADRVRVCTVTTGGGPITVVCGAWNFEAGATVAFAQPGAVLPGDFEIGVRKIRGVESHGMICSEKELDIGDDADGILVLDEPASPGAPLEDVVPLPDVLFDLAITTNRPDAMSIFGIARDLAAWYDIPIRMPDPRPATVPGDAGIEIDIQDPEGNPRFVARRLDGVTVRPSPLWMKVRLRNAGIRPISNLVDVTNYVMLELGQPLHVFDADEIAGDRLTIHRAQPGQRLVTLDGVDRELDPTDLVISDEEGPTSLAGTMGGERSEVSDKTTSTILEAAAWDPPSILHTSHRLGLRSEASARFERGVDPQLPPLASLRAAELIVETAGASLREGWVDAIARPFEPTVLELTVSDVTRLLGDRFDAATIETLLTRLGFVVTNGDPMRVEVPSYRPDVSRPVDLVEEVARLADYDTFGERLRVGRGGGLTADQQLVRRLTSTLVSLGLSQTINLPFVSPADLAAFDAPAGHELGRTIRVKNPLSEEEAVLRPSLLPGILRVIRHNRNRGRRDVAVFEHGRVFHAEPWHLDGRVPRQPDRIAFAVVGRFGPLDLEGNGRPVDIHVASAIVRHLADRHGLDIHLQQGDSPGFHPTRTALVVHGTSVVGMIGELHPATASTFDLEDRVAVGELDLELLLGAKVDPRYSPVSPYPPADFDLSFEVPADLAASELVHAVSRGGSDLVESVRVFDEFRGPGLGDGRKALAITVRLRAADRTLSAEDIARTRADMIDAATSVGAALRGSA